MKCLIILLSFVFISSSAQAQLRKFRAYEYCTVILNDQNAKCNFEKSNILIVVEKYQLLVYTPDILQLKFASPTKVIEDNLTKKVVSTTMEDQNGKYLELKFITDKSNNASVMVLTFFNKKMNFKLGPANDDD